MNVVSYRTILSVIVCRWIIKDWWISNQKIKIVFNEKSLIRWRQKRQIGRYGSWFFGKHHFFSCKILCAKYWLSVKKILIVIIVYLSKHHRSVPFFYYIQKFIILLFAMTCLAMHWDCKSTFQLSLHHDSVLIQMSLRCEVDFWLTRIVIVFESHCIRIHLNNFTESINKNGLNNTIQNVLDFSGLFFCLLLLQFEQYVSCVCVSFADCLTTSFNW